MTINFTYDGKNYLFSSYSQLRYELARLHTEGEISTQDLDNILYLPEVQYAKPVTDVSNRGKGNYPWDVDSTLPDHLG